MVGKVVNKTVDLEMDFPEALRLADLWGISVDLEAVQEYCKRLTDSMGEGRDHLVSDALWIAAVVRYARCFTDNRPVRPPLGDRYLRGLPEDLKQAHLFFRNLRNKHMAHSESSLEQNRIGVDLDIKEGSEPKINGISLHNQNVFFCSPPTVKALLELSAALLSKVNEELEVKEQLVLEKVKQRPLEEFYAKAHWELNLPSLQDASIRRMRGTTSNPRPEADT